MVCFERRGGTEEGASIRAEEKYAQRRTWREEGPAGVVNAYGTPCYELNKKKNSFM